MYINDKTKIKTNNNSAGQEYPATLILIVPTTQNSLFCIKKPGLYGTGYITLTNIFS